MVYDLRGMGRGTNIVYRMGGIMYTHLPSPYVIVPFYGNMYTDLPSHYIIVPSF